MHSRGFTLIELLVVIAIIGVLASVILASLNTARLKANDAGRLSDMSQTRKALEFYYDQYGRYPSSDVDGCGGWDVGNKEYAFISGGLGTAMSNPPEDPIATGNCNGYRFYRYPAGSSGCDANKGAFYVLGVTNMEATVGTHPSSPGWRCPLRNWQTEMEWVTGAFEH